MSPAENQRIIVVGASAAGLKAAARARRLMPGAEILVLEERDFFSYAACGLPYFLSGDVDNLDILRQTPHGTNRDAAFFAAVKGLEVRTGVRVVRIDPDERLVKAVVLESGERPVYPFDQLVIATGSGPRPLAGVEPGPACGYFHTPEEAAALRKGLETGQVGSVVVVGGGYIGIELAGAFSELWGCEVTVLEATEGLLPQILDPEMAAFVAGKLRRGGIQVRTGLPVHRAATTNGQAAIQAGGETFVADRAVVAVGVEPRVSWAGESGFELGPRGGLKVDDELRTNFRWVFAAGDCIEVRQQLTDQQVLIPMGSLANRQGRVVGDNLAGGNSRFGPVNGASCVKLLDWTVAAAGLTARQAVAAGIEVRTIWGTFMDRAHYYPDHKQIHLKLVYEHRTRRLLGLQAVGEGEVVKRVDVFSALLHREGRLEDLPDLEFCYAPPYNTALDPLHGLGCAALNQEETGVVGLDPLVEPGERTVLDVRSPGEITEELPSPPGALNIPLGELRGRVEELPRQTPLLVVCAMGVRSSEAARWLQYSGFDDVVFLAGGINMREQA